MHDLVSQILPSLRSRPTSLFRFTMSKRSNDAAIEKIPLVKLPTGISRRDSGRHNVLRLVVGLALIMVVLLAVYTREEEDTKVYDSTTKTFINLTDSDLEEPPVAIPQVTPTVPTPVDTTPQTVPPPAPIDTTSDDPFDYLNQHEVIPHLQLPQSDASFLLEQFQTTKQELILRLGQEYGTDTAQQLFWEQPLPFTSPLNQSRGRMIRQLQTKLLQVQLQQQQQSDSANTAPTFIWATGGHSAAAGHGNYFNESYTARLEQLAKPIFASLGVHFVGRNYAMGGTSSGLEVGSCVDQIFGLDIDVLSWDYGMTDGRGVGIFENYFAHAAIHPNRPSMIAFNAGGRSGPARQAVIQAMEEHGMAIMSLEDGSVARIVRDVLPESFGLSQEQLQSMGPLVRNMKCDGQVEVGDPFCGSERWSPLCPERKYKAKWHPGWYVFMNDYPIPNNFYGQA